jgi:ketosteroid isomerase-like protein
MAAVDRLLADDVTWHAPGNAQHAGVRRGKAELYASMGRLAELTSGTLRSEVVDILANDRRAVVIQRTRAQRDGRPDLDDREVIVYEFASMPRRGLRIALVAMTPLPSSPPWGAGVGRRS